MEEIIQNINIYLILDVIIILGLIIISIRMSNLNKKYKEFMKKLGNGKNIEEDLEAYMYRVNKVEEQNVDIIERCKSIEKQVMKSIQKVGIVRYNAYEDTGSNLSFALAMLDESNNGIVLNGIYSREMSNIYAKPIENGKSSYAISEEEQQAINKAIQI